MRLVVLAFSPLLMFPLASDPALARPRSDHHQARAGDHDGRPHAGSRHDAHALRRAQASRAAHRSARRVASRWGPTESREPSVFSGGRWSSDRETYPRGDQVTLGRFRYWSDDRGIPPFAAPPAAWAERFSGELSGMIARHAQMNGVPETLVRRVVLRESGGNPRAIGSGGAMGLMQIKTSTARAMGYSGPPSGLLDADTNLTYAVRYLAGAYRVAGGNADRAVSHYARGYYRAAKARGVSSSRPYGDRAEVYGSY
jgi:hypothetical protein